VRTQDDLNAEAATVRQLLDMVPPENVIDIASLKAQLASIEKRIAQARVEPEIPKVELYFSGDPVLGTRGIETTFAARVIDKYSEAVQAKAGELRGRKLKALGPVPMRTNHRLFIVDKLAGSFGFALEAIQPDSSAEDGESLRNAIAAVDGVIEGSLKSDDALSEAIGSTQDRVLSLVKDFLNVCYDGKARFRIAEPNRSTIEARGSVEIRDAAARLETTTTTAVVARVGWLRGVLPENRRFEFQEDGEEHTRTGRIDDEIDDQAIAAMHKTFLDQKCTARFRATQVGANARLRRYVLLGIDPLPKT
jgi:hypothetical protein